MLGVPRSVCEEVNPPLAGQSALQLVTGKRDGFHRPLLVDELFVGRLPAGPQKFCVPVRDELAGVPLTPVGAPQFLQPLLVVHVLVLSLRHMSAVLVERIQ